LPTSCLAFHCSLKRLPDTVQPDGYTALFLTEHLSQFPVAQTLNIAQQKHDRVVVLKHRKSAPELFL
jgi:hypothetical protein